MAIYGYARVSSVDQDLKLQKTALKKAGCEIIRAEKRSGTTQKGREELEILLKFLRCGDELVILRIDRLARSIKDLQDIVATLNEKGVTLRTVDGHTFDTKSSMGKAFFDMLGVFAEFETNLRRERQLEGIEQAKQRGVYKGRRPSIDPERVRQLRDDGKGATAIAQELGIGRASVYRVLNGLTASN